MTGKLASCSQFPVVMTDSSDENVREIQLTGSSATLAGIEGYFKRLNRTAMPHLLLISAFQYRSDVYELFGKSTTEFTFAKWKELFDHSSNKRQTLRFAKLVKAGTDVRIDFVDNGEASYVVRGSNDPTVFFISQNLRCHILQISPIYLPIGVPGGEPKLRIWVYVQAQRLPTPREAEAIFSELRRRLGTSHLRVLIRTDSWFIEDTRFPIWYPFAPDERPPNNLKEYKAAGEVFCKETDGRTDCRDL